MPGSVLFESLTDSTAFRKCLVGVDARGVIPRRLPEGVSGLHSVNERSAPHRSRSRAASWPYVSENRIAAADLLGFVKSVSSANS
jgi:hypothetical protein